MNWLDNLDKALGIDARVAGDIDRVRLARLRAVRELVSSRLNSLDAEAALSSHSIILPQGAVIAPLEGAQDTPAELTAEIFADYSPFYVEPLSFAPLSLSLIETRKIRERKALRRILRLLDKVIMIVLRREALHDSLRQLVLRLRAFFVTHGDRPPRELSRHCLVPEASPV